MLTHPFPPVCDGGSRVLILGSFPSAASRAGRFYYHHPHNRFWPLLAQLLDEPFPETIPEREALLHRRHIALWDSAASCEITGSADASLRQTTPNDLRPLLAAAPIRAIFCNGTAAWEIYRRSIQPLTGREAQRLPSTSPANAAWSLEALLEAWSVVAAALE